MLGDFFTWLIVTKLGLSVEGAKMLALFWIAIVLTIIAAK